MQFQTSSTTWIPSHALAVSRRTKPSPRSTSPWVATSVHPLLSKPWDFAKYSLCTASADSITLLGLIFPSSLLGAAPILRVVSILGEGSNSKLQHHGRVQYKVQRRALEMLVQLVELGVVGPQGRDALESFWGILEQGLEYKTLRYVQGGRCTEWGAEGCVLKGTRRRSCCSSSREGITSRSIASLTCTSFRTPLFDLVLALKSYV